MSSYTIALEAITNHMAIQKIEELESLLDYIKDKITEPLVALEIGVQDGGTLWAWSQVFTKHTIGIDQSTIPRLDRKVVRYINGDSHNVDTFDRVCDILFGEEIDFLFIDGDHSYEGVKQDYEMYSPLVRKGGVIAFHDVAPHATTQQSEVNKFWAELRAISGFEGVSVHVHERRDTGRGPIPPDSCGIGMMIKQ